MAGKTRKAAVPENASAPTGEEEVFGDVGRDALPVTSEQSNDSFMQTSTDVPPETEVLPGADLPPAPVSGPVPMREITEDQIFGGAATPEAKGTGEQTVAVPMSVLEQMQRDIAELRAKDNDNIIDPLATGPRIKHLNATFFTDEAGKQWLVTDMMERVFPNGTRTKVYQDGVDKDTKKPIYKAVLKVADLETGETKNVEVVYENFIQLSTPVKTEAIKTNEVIVDLTPAEEQVEIVTYQENGNYIRRNGTGVWVRASVQGKVQTYEVEFNNRKFELSSDVVNIK